MSVTNAVTATIRSQLGTAWRAVRVWLIAALFALAAGAVVANPLNDGSDEPLALSVGDVSPADIIAPRSITYISEHLTNAQRDAAVAGVSAIYTPQDPGVARQQITRANAALSFINSVRADSYATPEQKRGDLSHLTDIRLPRTTMDALLQLSDSQWQAVRDEVPTVIEEVMSVQVREDRVDEARRRIPGLVSVILSVEEADIVSALAGGFVAPNSLYDEAATEAARAIAREAVEPVSQSFIQGQTIVSRGNVITELDLEALQVLDLLERTEELIDPRLPPILAVALVTLVMSIYILRFRPEYVDQLRFVIYLCLVAFIFVATAQVMIPERAVMPYLFPEAALGMLVAVALGPRTGVVVVLLFSVVVAVVSGGRVDVTLYLAIGSLVAILTLGSAERVTNYVWAGIATAAASMLMILILRLPDLANPDFDLVGLLTLLGASIANGALSASTTLMGFFLLGSIFDIISPLRLVELARPNHPLLQELLRRAPGTYQHSLQVANLAEQAAQRIGANSLLVRVGALYHDIGKAKHAQYFIENQIQGENPHDWLDPTASAQIIIDHVRDGGEMARRHRLPSAIRAAILEHHGTLVTQYQYRKAIEAAGDGESLVNLADFTYPGPKPQSRETALLMLADACEAKARADVPRTVEDIDEIVRYIINRRVQQGQLDECDLTLADIRATRLSFVNTLKGLFHGRLKYPEPAALPDTQIEEQPATLEEAATAND